VTCCLHAHQALLYSSQACRVQQSTLCLWAGRMRGFVPRRQDAPASHMHARPRPGQAVSGTMASSVLAVAIAAPVVAAQAPQQRAQAPKFAAVRPSARVSGGRAACSCAGGRQPEQSLTHPLPGCRGPWQPMSWRPSARPRQRALAPVSGFWLRGSALWDPCYLCYGLSARQEGLQLEHPAWSTQVLLGCRLAGSAPLPELIAKEAVRALEVKDQPCGTLPLPPLACFCRHGLRPEGRRFWCTAGQCCAL